MNQGNKVVPPPLERHVLVVAGVVALGAIMTVLATTVISVAIRTFADEFGAPLATIQWVSTAYLLALTVVIPLTGWAADRFGGKQLWMWSLVLFLVGSLLCALAWSVESLIVFRVIQGLGGGLVLPAGQALLAQIAGRERIGRVMSLVGIPLLLGPIFGPVVGGWLIDAFSWSWIFYINLPIGLIALPLSWKLIDETAKRPAQNVDLLGLVLLSPSLALLVYGLSNLVAGSPSAVTIGTLVAGVVLLALFIAHALRKSNALLDLKLFGDRQFRAANLVNALSGASMIGAMFVLPLYYQTLRGESALMAGLLTAPQAIGAALSMRWGGGLVDKGRAGVSVLSGAVLMAVGYLAFVIPDADASYVLLSAALFVVGVGAGLTITPAMSAAYRTLDQRSMPQATALLNIVQRIGGLLGTALFAVVLQANLGPQGLRGTVTPEAFAYTFWLPLACAALALLPALVLPRSPDRTAAPVTS
ncbi:DHA2 family efflux MFS transporter permease subunit [Lentzea nigeriaca]|uniref:DHA2 family efflux MFS transporter permease subunit n=1 Tax=Lentzea nigeriaca TaxID=1128665 RepID=UPI00195C93E6|nr:DHA2 family efflux MFS transporter permease subunit [Lentzea nigeriaca]MBM7856375.1 EmrB/QacA subfamily drug resistance transporter [Lentzea nigeriaca]